MQLRLFLSLVVACLATGSGAATAWGQSQSVTVKTCIGSEKICVLPQDDVWVVSARAECGCPDSVEEFTVKRLVSGEWIESDYEDLIADHQVDKQRSTILFAHGNHTNYQWALTRGLQFYRNIFCNEEPCRPPLRLVILAWSSERVCARPLKDFRIKASRAVELGPLLARFLDRFGEHRPVLVGYSLGCQVVLSAINDMPDEFCEPMAGQSGFPIALIAPALDPNFACRCLDTISTDQQIANASIFINSQDRVVSAARLVSHKTCTDPESRPSLLEMWQAGGLDRCRFQLHDISKEIRNRHAIVNYSHSQTLRCELIRMVRASAEPPLTAEYTVVSGED